LLRCGENVTSPSGDKSYFAENKRKNWPEKYSQILTERKTERLAIHTFGGLKARARPLKNNGNPQMTKPDQRPGSSYPI
jgi:hypothetical protein